MKSLIVLSLLLLSSSAMAIGDTEKAEVIQRCKNQMGQYGASMVDKLQQSNRKNYERSPNDHSKIGVPQW